MHDTLFWNVQTRMADRKRTDLNDKEVTFKLLSADTCVPFEKVTSVSVVPFLDKNTIIAVQNKRGLDIPGGHVQEGETAPEQTAKRESMEEAFIELENLRLSHVIESNYYGTKPEDFTYMLIYAAQVKTLLPFQKNAETSARLEISVRQFTEDYPHDFIDISEIIKTAQRLVAL